MDEKPMSVLSSLLSSPTGQNVSIWPCLVCKWELRGWDRFILLTPRSSIPCESHWYPQKGIVQKILNILDGIPFGKLYFQVAVLLRNSLLVSSLLCNSEAWFNLTHAELELLESVDLMLLRSIMKAPKSTPKEMFFLELGVLPLREMIRERRLNFVHYILSQEENSLIVKVFEKQLKNCTAKDWVKTVIDDLEKVGLNVTFE